MNAEVQHLAISNALRRLYFCPNRMPELWSGRVDIQSNLFLQIETGTSRDYELPGNGGVRSEAGSQAHRDQESFLPVLRIQ